MDQATATLQQRNSRLDRKLTAGQIEELASLVGLLGFRLTPIKAKATPKAGKPVIKSKWYKPQSLAQLGANCRSSAYGLTAIAWERLKENYTLGRGGPWPSDIAAFHAGK